MTKGIYHKIDGVVLPTPYRCTTTEYDLDSATTGRPESGFLHRERKRGNVIECELEFRNLTESEARLIHDLTEPPSFVYEKRFLGQTVQRQMYAGDRHWDERYNDQEDDVQIDLTVKFSEY